MDISALEIQMNSQERRAKLQKAKLDIELDIEQNELQTQMDIAKRERELLKTQERQSSSYVNIPPAQTPEQEQRKEFEDEVTKMIGDCYAFLGTGKVDGYPGMSRLHKDRSKQRSLRLLNGVRNPPFQFHRLPQSRGSTLRNPRSGLCWFLDPPMSKETRTETV